MKSRMKCAEILGSQQRMQSERRGMAKHGINCSACKYGMVCENLGKRQAEYAQSIAKHKMIIEKYAKGV